MNNTSEQDKGIKPTMIMSSKKTVIIFLAAAVLLLLAIYLPSFGVLSKLMVSSICFIAMALLLWIFHPIPIGAVSLLVIVLQPLVGLTESLNVSFAGFTNAANYFVIASFGYAMALRKTRFSQRVLIKLLNLCKEDVKKITLAFMTMTFLLSCIMSDITAVVIAVGFAMELINLIKDETEKKRLGRMILIAVPIASLLGGTSTPVGSTINVMGLNILKGYNGTNVTFLQWMALGLPVALVMLFISWFIITRFYHADNIESSVLVNFENKTKIVQSDLKSEKLVLFILFAIIVAWVGSSWIKVLNTTTIAIIGLAILMMPGVRAFTWEEFKMNVPWEIMLMGGAVISLGNIAVQNGLVSLVIEQVTGGFSNINVFTLIVVVGGLVTVLLTIIPIGPAMISMLTIPAYLMAEQFGINPVMIVIVVGMFASNSSILPLNAVQLIPYTKGYYKIGELARVGFVMSIVWIFIAALWISFSSPLIF
ncbi:MAG: SLC13 family permease [Eubacteriaceae bacterium]